MPMHQQRDGAYLAENGYRAQREVAVPWNGRWGGDWFLRDTSGKVVDVCHYLSDLLGRNGYRLAEAYEC